MSEVQFAEDLRNEDPPAMPKNVRRALEEWMCWVRKERREVRFNNPAYHSEFSREARMGYHDGLKDAETRFGLLMYELGIDLSHCGG